MPPVEFEINAKRSASLSSDVATKPATTSLCPPKYFVAECKQYRYLNLMDSDNKVS